MLVLAHMELFTLANLIALFTLTALEIVLGIDNIIFLAILVDKLKVSERKKARFIGLSLALLMRIVLLIGISKIMLLTDPLVSVADLSFSGRDLIMLAGGLFLIWKATHEVHAVISPEQIKQSKKKIHAGFTSVIIQIALVDLVFSIDSVITAVGMANEVIIMVIAVVIAILVMLFFSDYISKLIERHPTLKVLALAFILFVGVLLLADGFSVHINRGYLYFAMVFSLLIELVNIRARVKNS